MVESRRYIWCQCSVAVGSTLDSAWAGWELGSYSGLRDVGVVSVDGSAVP